jgi:ribonuclease HII
MLKYEQLLWSEGFVQVAGVDEVGRGCLFGDVVAAAVILPKGLVIDGVDDSKKLSEKKREQLFEVINAEAIAVGIGRVDAPTIDRINIRQASRLAMKLAVQSLPEHPDSLLIDAESVDLPLRQLSIIHGDALSQSIAAASIIAKVTRDRMCLNWDLEYPGYGIQLHKGYATRMHRERIIAFGASPMHRMTFLRKITSTSLELFSL